MRENLIQYVNLLFAGTIGTEDIRQEILQNTLDRYDDLVAQGKAPEAAYRLAIAGIGDINEILGSQPASELPAAGSAAHTIPTEEDTEPVLNRLMRAVAIGLYIISISPLLVLSQIGMDEIGLIGTLSIVAIATVLLLLFQKPGKDKDQEQERVPLSPKDELKRSIGKLISALGLALYFVLSFATGAWYITWLVFPIIAAVKGLTDACVDLKEEMEI